MVSPSQFCCFGSIHSYVLVGMYVGVRTIPPDRGKRYVRYGPLRTIHTKKMQRAVDNDITIHESPRSKQT